ncbi:MAG: zf-HC2 domain-containing protein [Actinomycetota bacterium]
MGEKTDRGPECLEALREIEAFLDGESDTVVAARIELHLADCGRCMDRADFRRHLKDLVRERCQPESVPEHVMEKIRAMVREVR